MYFKPLSLVKRNPSKDTAGRKSKWVGSYDETPGMHLSHALAYQVDYYELFFPVPFFQSHCSLLWYPAITLLAKFHCVRAFTGLYLHSLVRQSSHVPWCWSNKQNQMSYIFCFTQKPTMAWDVEKVPWLCHLEGNMRTKQGDINLYQSKNKLEWDWCEP